MNDLNNQFFNNVSAYHVLEAVRAAPDCAGSGFHMAGAHIASAEFHATGLPTLRVAAAQYDVTVFFGALSGVTVQLWCLELNQGSIFTWREQSLFDELLHLDMGQQVRCIGNYFRRLHCFPEAAKLGKAVGQL